MLDLTRAYFLCSFPMYAVIAFFEIVALSQILNKLEIIDIATLSAWSSRPVFIALLIRSKF